MAKLWGGRFSKTTDEMINECNIFQKLKKEYLIVREID